MLYALLAIYGLVLAGHTFVLWRRRKEVMVLERKIKDQYAGVTERILVGLIREKIEGAKAGLRQLLLRKKKQRISRAAFEKSKQDYLKTIQKATTATDRILLTIQEEAGEI